MESPDFRLTYDTSPAQWDMLLELMLQLKEDGFLNVDERSSLDRDR